MFNKEDREKIKEQIAKFHDEFGGDALNDVKNGTWLGKIIQKILKEHAQKVNAEYFKKKYPGLDNERIAHQLIKTASQHIGIASGVIASAITASELAISRNQFRKIGFLTIQTSFLGEIAYITYMQLKLVYDISILLDARLEQEDPEDMLIIFWYALGIKHWETFSNALLKNNPIILEHNTQRILRSKLFETIQKVVFEVGGPKLAKKLTKNAVLKLIVPGVNIPVTYIVNKKFTTKLGKYAIKNLQHRGIIVRLIDELKQHPRETQLLAISIIFHVGISDEPIGINSRIIEMQNVLTRRLNIEENESFVLNDWIRMEFNEFINLREIRQISPPVVGNILYKIGICSHVLSKAPELKLDKLKSLADALSVSFNEDDIEIFKNKLHL